MTGRRRARSSATAAIALAVVVGLPPLAAAAVRVHFADGRTLHAKSALRDGDDWLLRLEAGTMTVPAARVSRIETVEDADARPGRGVNVVGASGSRRSAGSRDRALRSTSADAETRLRHRLVADPSDASAIVSLGRLLADEGRLREAVAMLERARPFGCCDAVLAERPDLVRSRALTLADALNRLDRPEEALEALDGVPDDPQGNVASLRERLRRDVSLRGERSLRTTSRFVLQGPDDTPRGGADELLDELESAHAALRGALGDAPPERVVVILYEGNEFWESTGRRRTIGGLFDGKVRVPVGSIDPPNERLRRVLRHEVAHAFVHALGRGRASTQWHEGIAEHFEGVDVAGRDADLARHLERGGAWPPPVSHATAHSRFEHFLERCGGHRATSGLLEELGRGASEDAALESACGLDSEELDESWARALRGGRR